MVDSPKKIVINATSVVQGGALTILHQFLGSIKEYDPINKYFLITSLQSDRFDTLLNVSILKTDRQSWIERLYWDFIGFRLFCKKLELVPDIIISFQNTAVRFPSIPQIVYFHQNLALFKHKWSIFNRRERVMFFYSNFYIFFVRRYINSNTKFVVQLESTRQICISKLKINSDQIVVVKPDISIVRKPDLFANGFSDTTINLFYPSYDYPYKNHKIIIQALALLKKRNYISYSKLNIFFTLNKEESAWILSLIKKYDVEHAITFVGKLSYKEVIKLYATSDALVFPSFIESFGLPLLEAAQFGLPIIVSDLPYSREVLQGYEGSVFVNYDDALGWSNSIEKVTKRERFNPLNIVEGQNSWQSFHEVIKKAVVDV